MAITIQQVMQNRQAKTPATTTASRTKPGSAKTYLDSLKTAEPAKQEGFLSEVGQGITKRGQQLKDIVARTYSGQQTPIETGLQTAGTGIGALTDVVGAAIGAIPGVKPALGAIGQAGMAIPGAKEVVSAVGSKWASLSPRTKANLGAVGNIASILPIGKAGEIGSKAIIEGAGKAVASITEKLGAKAGEKELNNAISAVAKDVGFMTKKEKLAMVRSGDVTPQEIWKSAAPVVSDEEKRLAQKFLPQLGSGSNVEKATRMHDYITAGSKEMEKYLTDNKVIFNEATFRKYMMDTLNSVYPKGVNEGMKKNLVTTLLAKMDTKDMLGAWRSRIKFDKTIATLFGKEGLSAANELKTAVRNGLNDFIDSRITDSTYKAKLKDLSDAYKVMDQVAKKAIPEMSAGKIKAFMAKYPFIENVAAFIPGFRNIPKVIRK